MFVTRVLTDLHRLGIRVFAQPVSLELLRQTEPRCSVNGCHAGGGKAGGERKGPVERGAICGGAILLIKQRTSFLAAVTDKTLLDQEVSRRDKVPDVKRR